MPIDHNKNIIEVENLSFAFRKEDVVSGVSLQIHRGDYLGIVGPNGAGKSTLLKLILGLLQPRTGTIKIFGQDIDEFKDWFKIGYIPQKVVHFEHNFPATVEEVVAMGTYAKRGLFHFSTLADKNAVEKALKQVEMWNFKDVQISDLSGGQQQRVFIARALVTQPSIIFLDEPTVGVDVKTQKQFYQLLRNLNKRLRLTLILVTHELDIVAHEATELCYINKTMEYYGDPEEFLKGEYFHELIGKGGLRH